MRIRFPARPGSSVNNRTRTNGRCSLASSHSGTRIPSHIVFVLQDCSGVQLKPGTALPARENLLDERIFATRFVVSS